MRATWIGRRTCFGGRRPIRPSGTDRRPDRIPPRAVSRSEGVVPRRCLQLKPDNVPALTALGRLELLDHNDAEAMALLEHALRLNPSDAESTYQLGVLYDRNGARPKA